MPRRLSGGPHVCIRCVVESELVLDRHLRKFKVHNHTNLQTQDSDSETDAFESLPLSRAFSGPVRWPVFADPVVEFQWNSL
jgi:hypothetical protein